LLPSLQVAFRLVAHRSDVNDDAGVQEHVQPGCGRHGYFGSFGVADTAFGRRGGETGGVVFLGDGLNATDILMWGI